MTPAPDLEALRGATIPQRFAAQVRKTPDAVAVVAGAERVTYAELDQQANALAARLASIGVAPGACVVLEADRSVAAIASLLGISKLGAAYVPADPGQPRERLAVLVEDCEASAIVTTSRFRSVWPPGVPVVCLDEAAAAPSPGGGAPCLDLATPQGLAYVLFTSGSTGRPKGVMIEHHSVINLADALFDAVYERQERPLRVSLNAPLSFDASVQQIVQVFFGHELWIIPEAVRRDGESMLAFLREARIDVLDATPAHLRMLFAANLHSSRDYAPEIILVGGDALDAQTWRTIRRSTRPRVYNVYGPTECTVEVTACHVQSGPAVPTIGRPLPGSEVMVVRSDMTLCDEGETGEICISGRGVGRGYLKDPVLTAERFVPNPITGSGARAYRTGDLGRWMPDGNLEFLGRSDFQVKIRGYRIELGEIETILRSHPAVRDVVVVAHEDGRRDKRLVAYVVARDTPPTVSELRSFCCEHLPTYMVPGVFMGLSALPLTGNGKVDRRALPAPDTERPLLDAELVAPEDAVQAILVELFSSVLRVQPVGIHDNFFDLGGDSLAGLKIHALARERGVSFPLEALLEHPTVAELARLFMLDGDRR
ncbi:MAG: non-ribosomal peptide synthetase [Minicystis sp.]